MDLGVWPWFDWFTSLLFSCFMKLLMVSFRLGCFGCLINMVFLVRWNCGFFGLIVHWFCDHDPMFLFWCDGFFMVDCSGLINKSSRQWSSPQKKRGDPRFGRRMFPKPVGARASTPVAIGFFPSLDFDSGCYGWFSLTNLKHEEELQTQEEPH